MVALTVRIKKRIFASPETGFGVFQVQAEEAGAPSTIVGSLFDLHEGDRLRIEGEEVQHPRFGRQIRVENFTLLLPEDEEGIVRYLASGRIKGVGKKTAQKIVAQFGGATLKILEQDAAMLEKVGGIRRAVIDEVRRAFQESRVIRELAVKLSPYGIGMQTVHKIHQEFGEAALAVVTENPYLLEGRVRGISFRTADRIGRALHVPADDPHRLQSAIFFLLQQAEAQGGHLYVPQGELLARGAALLGVGRAEVGDQLAELVGAGRLAAEPLPDPAIVLPDNLTYEKVSAQRLCELGKRRLPRKEIVIHFDRIFSRLAVDLTAEQREAVAAAVGEPLVVITGGPGTGKTTIIRALIDIFRDNNLEVAIAAPTGRAAKRIEESSRYPAATLHRLLKINPQTGRFLHNRANPLAADVVIVDEFSMVDAFLLYSLLQAMPDHGQLIIIGDRDQLPSVGPGNVLRDIIASGFFLTITLTHNFRQSRGGLIVENACRVISGERPLIPAGPDDRDFALVPVEGPAQALQKVEAVFRYYREEHPFHSPNLQVLVPMYRGEAGIDEINRLVQERFNPGGFLLRREPESFKAGDKIMQVKNNYQKEVFNGDLGLIEGFAVEQRVLLANFDGQRVEYAADELDELTLAYAVSVHKSQGSEYDVVVLVLLPAHSGMFSRELLYTAITRAKKKLILLSDEETVWRAVRNSRPQLRRTLLPLRLKELFQA